MIDQNLRKVEGVIKKGGVRPITYDVVWDVQEPTDQLILFVHGFKGFKDWGIWNAVAREFTRNGIAFMKINFSHNGTTPDHLEDFTDLEAFGKNNFSREVTDIKRVVYALKENAIELPKVFSELEFTLIGHSRGGASAIIAASELNDGIDKLVTWAAIDDIPSRYGEFDENWKKDGVKYVENGRTGQQMPLYFQLYSDILANRQRFDLEKVLEDFGIPMLICHGDADPTVDVTAAFNLNNFNIDADLLVVKGGNHVFGGSHPYQASSLPLPMQEVIIRTVDFIND